MGWGRVGGMGVLTPTHIKMRSFAEHGGRSGDGLGDRIPRSCPTGAGGAGDDEG